jgi:hypothetical protein
MRTTHTKFTEPSNTLGRRVAELDRLDTAILMAAKLGTPLPSAAMIFRALSDASIASAEALENWDVTPIPPGVRNGLLRLQCSMTDLAASLKAYTMLSVSPGLKPAVQLLEPKAPSDRPYQLH